MKKYIYTLAIVFTMIFLIFSSTKANAETKSITVKLFWAEGCPHCAHEKEFLNGYVLQNPDVVVETYEITKNQANMQLLVKTGQELKADISGVPFTVIGKDYVSGFAEGQTDKEIIELIEKNRPKTLPVAPDNEGVKETTTDDNSDKDGVVSQEQTADTQGNFAPNQVIHLPLLGEINSREYSLPALSIIIGFIDGFNPCAMWTLLFLISILLGMKDRKRMWILGSAFIVSSALVYFLFMSAWLNLFLFIGFVAVVRIIIGLVAVGGGVFNVRDYFVNKEAGCKVTKSKKQQKIFDKIQSILHEKSFIMALFGIILLAFAVNLVELICSAGLPAVYTQILSLSDLAKWQYYFYILLYVLFFMLDDLFVFIVAMATLKLTGITTKYSRMSKLIGGSILLIIGIILILKPEWLMFG